MQAHQPFMQPVLPVQITIEATREMLDIIELRMEEVALAITRPVDPVVPHLVVLVAAAQEPDVRAMVASVDGSATLRSMKLADIDWVTQVQKDFPPFTLGRFYVYGSHAKERIPANRLPLLIDAVAAFGTGEHDTTAGCLLALQRLKQRFAQRREILDVGCGTAILGIGAVSLWKGARVMACDNDPAAVKVSQINFRANQVHARTRAVVSDGYRHREIRMLGKQEIIVANILAKPLMKMARDAARQLKQDGYLILSGLLNSQENMVLAAHRAQGLYLVERIRRGKWSVLVLAR